MSDGPAASDLGRVLIVDDEPLNVDYLEQELEELGYETETATTGIEALEKVAASPPDLVLLDVMMPELDGIATLRILKQDPETRLIPVVLMTALNAVEDRVRGIEAGADDFLSKPVDDRELLARIRTAISRKRIIDDTVRELHSTQAQLSRFGRQERDIAALAVVWQTHATDSAEGSARRIREAVEEHVGAHCGTLSEREPEAGLLIAAFEGSDATRRAIAAVDAALAILDGTRTGDGVLGAADVRTSVTAGRATVGSIRLEQRGDTRWAWSVDGPPVEHAANLVRDASARTVVVTNDIAATLSDRYLLEPAGDRVYAVVARAEGELFPARPAVDRYVTTLLVTDIVGSTSTLERVGDHAGGELLAAHERITRDELVLHGGDEINMLGDGFLASFASAARAIRCALAIMARVRDLGIVLRAGIHTGELERIEGTPRGIAMHITARIASRAVPGEVLVSTTTRDLATGAGLVFVDRGEHQLKGVADPRQLFAAVGERQTAIPTGMSQTHADPSRAAFPAGLTAREVDVLRLVAVGLSDAEVGKQLFVSVRTVNAHLRSIYRKTGLRSRAAASRFAEEHNLL